MLVVLNAYLSALMYFKSFVIFYLFIFNRPEGKAESEHYGRTENNTVASTTNLSQQLHSICQDQREGAGAFHQLEQFQAATTALECSPFKHPFCANWTKHTHKEFSHSLYGCEWGGTYRACQRTIWGLHFSAGECPEPAIWAMLAKSNCLFS